MKKIIADLGLIATVVVGLAVTALFYVGLVSLIKKDQYINILLGVPIFYEGYEVCKEYFGDEKAVSQYKKNESVGITKLDSINTMFIHGYMYANTNTSSKSEESVIIDSTLSYYNSLDSSQKRLFKKYASLYKNVNNELTICFNNDIDRGLDVNDLKFNLSDKYYAIADSICNTTSINQMCYEFKNADVIIKKSIQEKLTNVKIADSRTLRMFKELMIRNQDNVDRRFHLVFGVVGAPK